MSRTDLDLQAADHARAHGRWLPFLARLFESGALPLSDRGLPLGIEGLSRQAVEAAAAILREGCLLSLIRRGGWRAVPRPGASRARLWRDAEARSALRFTEESIELALLAFQMARRPLPASQRNPRAPGRRQIAAALRKLRLEAPGDLLVHHLVFERLRRAGLLEGWDEDLTCAGNPLNALFSCADGEGGEGIVEALARLDGPVGAWLPWLVTDLARRWIRSEARRWSSLDDFRAINERQSFALQYWSELGSADRSLILLPLAELYQAWMAKSWRPRSWLQTIARWTRGRPIYERQALTRRWLELYDGADAIGAAAAEVVAIHPLDREPEQAFFLERLAALGFEKRLESIAALRAEADPVIG